LFENHCVSKVESDTRDHGIKKIKTRFFRLQAPPMSKNTMCVERIMLCNVAESLGPWRVNAALSISQKNIENTAAIRRCSFDGEKHANDDDNNDDISSGGVNENSETRYVRARGPCKIARRTFGRFRAWRNGGKTTKPRRSEPPGNLRNSQSPKCKSTWTTDIAPRKVVERPVS